MNYLYATLCVNYVSSEITYIHVIFNIDTTDINAMLNVVCTE